jgi:hypothetical protein
MSICVDKNQNLNFFNLQGEQQGTTGSKAQ